MKQKLIAIILGSVMIFTIFGIAASTSPAKTLTVSPSPRIVSAVDYKLVPYSSSPVRMLSIVFPRPDPTGAGTPADPFNVQFRTPWDLLPVDRQASQEAADLQYLKDNHFTVQVGLEPIWCLANANWTQQWVAADLKPFMDAGIPVSLDLEDAMSFMPITGRVETPNTTLYFGTPGNVVAFPTYQMKDWDGVTRWVNDCPVYADATGIYNASFSEYWWSKARDPTNGSNWIKRVPTPTVQELNAAYAPGMAVLGRLHLQSVSIETGNDITPGYIKLKFPGVPFQQWIDESWMPGVAMENGQLVEARVVDWNGLPANATEQDIVNHLKMRIYEADQVIFEIYTLWDCQPYVKAVRSDGSIQNYTCTMQIFPFLCTLMAQNYPAKPFGILTMIDQGNYSFGDDGRPDSLSAWSATMHIPTRGSGPWTVTYDNNFPTGRAPSDGTHTMTNIQHANAVVNLQNIKDITGCNWNILILQVFFFYDYSSVHSIQWWGDETNSLAYALMR
jgi:hypothetical protein